MAITALCLGIRFTKTWYTSQKEKMLLLKERIRKNIQLQKSKVYPDVIKKSLTTLSKNLNDKSEDSPELLMAISDVFSYLLYSADGGAVEVKKEISILKQISYLENSISDNHFLISLGTTGNIEEDLFIHPLTLFSILQSGIDIMNEQIDKANELQFDIEISDSHITVFIEFNSLSDPVDYSVDWIGLLKKHIQALNIVDPILYKFVQAAKCVIQIEIDKSPREFITNLIESKILTRTQ